MMADRNAKHPSLVFLPFLVWLVVGAMISLALPHVTAPGWYGSRDGIVAREIIAAAHAGGTVLLFLLGMVLVLVKR